MSFPLPSPTPTLPPAAQALRKALGRFTTGVTIVTCLDADGTPVGLTANSFGSLSLEPPLVQWSLRRASANLAAFSRAPKFVVNVLAENQVELSRRFASQRADKFAEGSWTWGEGQAPVLAGAAAFFECALFAQHEVGDHRLFIGQVIKAGEAALPPLVFNAGHYHLLGEIL
jgi:flavin reductase (DIM6/NTAB) family NADH-FMN oxidoreductase RutF